MRCLERADTMREASVMNRGGILEAPGAAHECPGFADQSMEAPGAPPVRARVLCEESVERIGGAGNGALTG